MKTLIIVLFLLSITAAAAAPVVAMNCPAVKIQKRNFYGLGITKAAERNGCRGNLFNLLLAIRKAENGPPGFEFGVVAVKNTNLEKQAAWAAATIVKNHKRFHVQGCNDFEAFIEFLGNVYCPPSIDHRGNINWLKNVKFWFKKFEE
jgi:hypothetical protein